jgi:GT2 family glycosyltransferase
MVFNPLNHPICFSTPSRLSGASAWVGHIPFAFAAVSALRPRVLVELGTHHGDSYLAMCQAVASLGLETRTYAVDTWTGDIHAGHAGGAKYGANVFETLGAYHNSRYSAFSKLIRSTFDEAARAFPSESVDLLHIDGLHTYEAVKHDFETWLPKLSSRGVIMFHDTNVRTGDFGVWRLWEELRRHYPGIEFPHSFGLGVLGVGREIPQEFGCLLEAQPAVQEAARSFFALLGGRIEQTGLRSSCAVARGTESRAGRNVTIEGRCNEPPTPRAPDSESGCARLRREAQQTISVVICSVRDDRFERARWNLETLLARHPFEIIRIGDARSLAEGYNRGIERAKGRYVVLAHDDIEVLTEDFAERLIAHLDRFDVVGVAGARRLAGPRWFDAGLPFLCGQVAHTREDGSYSVSVFGRGSKDPAFPVEVLDGLFMAARREVFDTVRFDESNFDGFHLYDLDFSFRAHCAGYAVAVLNDLCIVHESGGCYDENWGHYADRFTAKHGAAYGARAGVRESSFGSYVCGTKDEVLRLFAATDAERREIAAYAGRSSLLEQPTAPFSIPSGDYVIWRKRRALQEIDGELFAERMMLRWNRQPLFHVFVELRQGEQALLADTIDSLAMQMYKRWRLTIVSADPAPDPEFGSTDVLKWITADDTAAVARDLGRELSASDADWVLFLEPGVRLEPQALLVLADYGESHLHWQLIYCDEDVMGMNGQPHSPQFKPDFDLDMFRSMNYLGTVQAVRGKAARELGGSRAGSGAWSYDLALRVVDFHGESAVGHVSDVLAHAPASGMRPVEKETEWAALRDHFGRRGIAVQLREGLGFGTQIVDHQHIGLPLVSIVIPSRDRLEYLRPCIESLTKQTSYSPIEIVIVDNGSADPDCVEYLSGLEHSEAVGSIAVRIVRHDREFNYAELCNRGAAQARGDYIVFLDNDTHIVQARWLDALLNHGRRPEVGIVGAKLGCPESTKVQDGWQVLGLGSVAGHPFGNRLDIVQAGYMGRATVDQGVAAVSGSCLLMRKAVLDQVGGMDESFPWAHAALDLCLRVRQEGYKVIWTPQSVVVHYGGATRAAGSDPVESLTRMSTFRSESDRLLSRWLGTLASDRSYNRNLSLRDGFKLETEVVSAWDPTFRDRPRVVGVPLSGGAGEYRITAPLRCVSRAGRLQTTVIHPLSRKEMRVLSPVELERLSPDSIVAHQPLADGYIQALDQYRRHNRSVLRIVAIDDLLTDLPRKNPFFRDSYKDARPRLRKVLGLADRVVVSTEPLAEMCKGMNADVWTVPNCLELAVWDGARSGRRQGAKARVGWAGAQQHQGDLEQIYEAVEQTADEVDWIFMGMCPDALRPYVREFHPFVGFLDYPARLAALNLDLAIAPLELNAFNEAKSNLRLLEYGFMAWPTIATDIYPYRNAPVMRVPNETSAWVDAIRERANDLDAAEREGDRLRQWVLDGFILEKRVDEWCRALVSLDRMPQRAGIAA